MHFAKRASHRNAFWVRLISPTTSRFESARLAAVAAPTSSRLPSLTSNIVGAFSFSGAREAGAAPLFTWTAWPMFACFTIARFGGFLIVASVSSVARA
jgi:hypothetical protein